VRSTIEAQGSLLGDEFQDAFTGTAGRASSAPRDRRPGHALVQDGRQVAARRQMGRRCRQPGAAARPEDWRQVQASAQACNGGQCEYFKSCAFFRARRRAASATIQVANHALILATLQTDSALIEAGNTLFVFDEAHHLPGIAADQFTYRARLGASVALLTSLRTLVRPAWPRDAGLDPA